MKDFTCECGAEKYYGRNMCRKCYMQWYRDSHPEYRARMAEQERKRRQKLGDEYRENDKERNKKRKKERLAYNREYYQQNSDALKQYQRDYRARERKKVQYSWRVTKQRRRGVKVKITFEQWERIVEFYCPDNLCLSCGQPFDKNIIERRLTMDHVVPMNRGGITSPGNVQPLCFSCNASKSDNHSTDYRHDKGIFACSLMDAYESSNDS